MSDILPPDNMKSKNHANRTVAVALENDRSNPLELPKISAVGHGKLAERILEIAFERGIKVRKDADLAQLLATIELDNEIPTEAVVAVAEILIQVYKANGELPQDYTPDFTHLKTLAKDVMMDDDKK